MATITKPPTIVSDPAPTSWNIYGGNEALGVRNDALKYCYANMLGYGGSDTLLAQGFNFSEIPDGSTINTMTVAVYAKISVAQANQFSLRMTLDGTSVFPSPGGTPRFTLTNVYAEYSSTKTPVQWKNSVPVGLTVAQIKNANFGLALSCLNQAAAGVGCYIDQALLTVDYTPPRNRQLFSGGLASMNGGLF